MERVFDRKRVWALLLPLVAEQLLASLMGTADTMMVASAGGAAVSAVSLVDTLNNLMIQVFSAIAVGGTILVSQHVGNQDLPEAKETARQLMQSITAIAGAVGLFCFFLRAPLLRLLYGEIDADVMREASAYLAVTALSFPFLALYSAGAAVFRCAGDARLPMLISVCANVLNVAGNAALIFGLRMGALGAAIPTLVSRAVCAVTVSLLLRDRRRRIPVRGWLTARPSRRRVGRILWIGLPNGVENGMFHFGKVLISSVISAMGTTALAANAVTASLEGVSGMLCMGVNMGLTTIVGVCMGARRPEEAAHWIRRCLLYCEALIVIGSGAVMLLARPLTRITGLDAEAADLAVRMTVFAHTLKPLVWVFAFTPAYGMRGAGDVRFSMIASAASMWLCRVTVTVILAKTTALGPLCMWIGMASDWGLRAVIFMLRFRRGKWALHRVV